MSKVDKNMMPKIVEDAFNKWAKEQFKDFKGLTEERKAEVNFTILKQMGKMDYNLKQLGYIK